MKIRELQEGFLDDLAAAMRDADSFGDFLKGLGGGNAKLDQISRKLLADAERVLVSGQTNLRQPGITDADIPMDRLIVAVFNAAAEFSKTSKNPVTRNDLFSHFKKHQDEILKGMNMQARGANLARSGTDEVNKLLARQPTEAISGAGLKGNLEAISLLAALTLLDIEYRRATDQESTSAEGFEFEDSDLQDFNAAGDQLLKTLFAPGSPVHRALQIDAGFKNNMKKFVEQLHSQIQKEYAGLNTKQLISRAGQINQVVQPLELQSALTGHINFNNPNLPDGYEQAINDMLTKSKNSFDTLLKYWVELALKERESTGSEISQEAFSILTNWAARALRLLDNIQISVAPKAQAAGTRAGQEIPSAGQEKQTPSIFKDLEAAHDAGSDALKRALNANPNLSPADQRRIYDRAADAAAGSAGR